MQIDAKKQIMVEFETLLHDVKSPLTSILGFAQLMLEDESITGVNREYLELISNDAENLNRTIIDRLERIGRLLETRAK